MRIGLLGFEFSSSNKGCEALSYSFLNLINKYFKEKNLEVLYFSNNGLGSIPDHFKDLKISQVNLKIKDPSMKMIRAMHSCKYIFDVTMGDSFSDIYSKELCLNDIKFKTIAELVCNNYVLLPQTYGPFKNKVVLQKSKKLLDKAKVIFCRDSMSYDYVKKISRNRNVDLTTDMAFMLPYDSKKYFISKSKINIGINISGLLIRGGFNSKNQFGLNFDYSEYIDEVLNYLSQDDKYCIHLIPHVIGVGNNARDDDYKSCEAYKIKFPNCILTQAFDNPIDAKSYISNMDCFIGARMHSTIASFSSGVATIPFSYSRKFEGLFNDLKYPYIIHGKSDDLDLAVNKTISYINDYQQLQEKVVKSLAYVKKKENGFINNLQMLD